jgi:NAD(P)-dependent dehydrogenase (short-subunit alcohol dehydrogenase family)
MGWRIIAVGRNPQRCEAAAQSIAAAGDGGVDMIRADLSLMSEAGRVASQIAELTERVQVLVNNAGGMATEKVVTREGLEQNFAANHLGPFLLTTELIPLLRRAALESPPGSVRILNTSSDASEMIESMPWGDLQSLRNFTPGGAYCSSKLANVLFARGLAIRLAADGIVAHAMHPGSVDSNFISYAPESAREYMRTLDLRPPEEGADTLLWLATAEEPGRSSGGYFFQRQSRTPNPLVDDENAVERLWRESEALVRQVAA